ncbi:hypothetical protein BHM03_00049596 [Ensete ventricosum]|nr:hypothetical protein BHM03_00049596 [Ensete ventricosum]
MLHPGVTQEWVDEGELLREQKKKSEMAKALRCVGRGHTWRSHSPSSSHENLYAKEMSPGGDMVQRIVMVVRGNATQAIMSHEGQDHAELDCFNAHIRLREPVKSEDKVEGVGGKGDGEDGTIPKIKVRLLNNNGRERLGAKGACCSQSRRLKIKQMRGDAVSTVASMRTSKE